jgi:DNA-binding NarL/FixJ family response regulator
MSLNSVRCVLLADRHHGLTESIRGLLETTFDAVVMVADERSLIESAAKLQPRVVVADMTLARGESFGWLRRLLAEYPEARVVVISFYDEQAVKEAAFAAGAAGFVLKRELATRLLPTIEAVLADHPIATTGDKPGDES